MQKDTIIKVLNRSNGQTIYSIPEMNGLRRVYEAGEKKDVTLEELQKLSYIPGGMELLRDNLVILNNDAAIKEILGDVEQEYSYTEEDIKKLMVQGSLDEFLDCLDFAPQGVKDLIKKIAVELPLNDVQKRQAILEKLGFNVDNAIRLKRQEQDQLDATNNQKQIKKRRVQSQQNTEKEEEKEDSFVPVRRVIKK